MRFGLNIPPFTDRLHRLALAVEAEQAGLLGPERSAGWDVVAS